MAVETLISRTEALMGGDEAVLVLLVKMVSQVFGH
jgi:hypothetical protein